jgi:hypothetical protein
VDRVIRIDEFDSTLPEDTAQLAAATNPKLRVCPMEMRAHGAVGQVDAVRNLFVGHPARRLSGDEQLLAGQ